MFFKGLGSVQIIQGPEDVAVEEGGTANFPCLYNGTFAIPYWKINGSLFSVLRLPRQHSYFNYILRVKDVTLSLNSTTYQCMFQDISSPIATLTIFSGTYACNTLCSFQ